jgi:hypothetical protein
MAASATAPGAPFIRCPQPPQKAKAEATALPQFGHGTISTGGGEKGEAWGWMAGTAVAGTDVDSDGAAGDAMGLGATGDGLGRTGTCMGTDPRPICTEGADVGMAARGPDPGTAAAGAKAGAWAGGGVGAIGWAWPGKAPNGLAAAPAIGSADTNAAGSGGTAVLATLSEGANSGGGVGGSISGGGAGLGAGAPACNLAPQPRQNL